MILLLAVLGGALAGWARAWAGGRHYRPASLSYTWLVAAAVLPQGLAFYFPLTRDIIPDGVVRFLLIGSQAGLLVFVWLNRRQPGFWILGMGLALNLLVISANGGLMPISPETVAQLIPDHPPDAWQTGVRLGWSKDVILPSAGTNLWWLSDRFLLPAWFPQRVAFSIGDVLIALGAFWLLWAQGGPTMTNPDMEHSVIV